MLHDKFEDQFPIVDYEDLDGIVRALRGRAGVFITGHRLQPVGELLIRRAEVAMRLLDACPPLDPKTMFPEALASAPDAKRMVVQAYVGANPAFQAAFSAGCPADLHPRSWILQAAFWSRPITSPQAGHE